MTQPQKDSMYTSVENGVNAKLFKHCRVIRTFTYQL